MKFKIVSEGGNSLYFREQLEEFLAGEIDNFHIIFDNENGYFFVFWYHNGSNCFAVVKYHMVSFGVAVNTTGCFKDFYKFLIR